MKKRDSGSLIAAIVIFIIAFTVFRSIGCSRGCAGCMAGGCAADYAGYDSCAGCVVGGCVGSATGCGGRQDASASARPTTAPVTFKVDIEPTSYVYANDYAGVLSAEQLQSIASAGQQLYRSTGVQLVTVVINDAERLSNDALQDYAYRVYNAWGIGDKSTDKGVLLMINTAEGVYLGNAYCIEGTGLESLLPASELGAIISDKVLPRLDERGFASAVTDGYAALESRIAELCGGN